MTHSSPINNIMKHHNSFFNNSSKKYHLYTGERLNWLQVIFKVESSVIPVILPWVLFYGLYGFFISLLNYSGFPVAFPKQSGFITNAILSFNIGLTLLLVFRTNTAHERFWEGRKLWGALVNTSRNLARGIWVAVQEKSPQDRGEKEAILRLIAAFGAAMKLHLRGEFVNDELVKFMSSLQYFKLKEMNHPPLEIAFWIGDYLQDKYERNCLNVYQLTALHRSVDELVNILGGCERILKTPLPLIYSIRLKQLVLIYCLLLPFEIVRDLNWWTGIIIAFVSFILLSIEQIGSEIEEPFGRDANDLPLDVICNTIRGNIEELIKSAPSTNIAYRHSSNTGILGNINSIIHLEKGTLNREQGEVLD